MMIELSFWVGLALSIPLSVLANILTPKLIAYLERRKILKTTRARQQETRVYERTRAFKNGKRDRYAFYFICATSAILCMIMASAILIVIFINPFSFDDRLVALAIVGGLIVLSVTLTLAIHITAYNLENLGDYERRFKERWPDTM